MSYQTWRDETIAELAGKGMRIDTIRGLLRAATTLQRLAVAQCNGDWPADNGERRTKVCDECGSCWAPSVLKRRYVGRTFGSPMRPVIHAHSCPDCRTSARVVALLRKDAPAWRAVFQGDPRGCVLRVVPAATTEADVQSGRVRGVGIPARS